MSREEKANPKKQWFAKHGFNVEKKNAQGDGGKEQETVAAPNTDYDSFATTRVTGYMTMNITHEWTTTITSLKDFQAQGLEVGTSTTITTASSVVTSKTSKIHKLKSFKNFAIKLGEKMKKGQANERYQ